MDAQNFSFVTGVVRQLSYNVNKFPVVFLVMTVFWLLFILFFIGKYNAGFHALAVGFSTLSILAGRSSNGVVQKLVG